MTKLTYYLFVLLFATTITFTTTSALGFDKYSIDPTPSPQPTNTPAPPSTTTSLPTTTDTPTTTPVPTTTSTPTSTEYPTATMDPSSSSTSEGTPSLGTYSAHANCDCDMSVQNPCNCYKPGSSSIDSTNPAFDDDGANGKYAVTTTGTDHTVHVYLQCNDSTAYAHSPNWSHDSDMSCSHGVYDTNKYKISCTDKSWTHPKYIHVKSYECGKYTVVGKWLPYGQFPVGEGSSITISIGYNEGQVTTHSSTFSESVTTTAAAGISVQGVSGTASLSKTQSQSIATEDSNSWSTTQSWSYTDYLDDSDIGLLYWQWVYIVTQPNGGNVTSYSQNQGGATYLAKTSDFSIPPKCVGGKDAHDPTYQTCINDSSGNWYLDQGDEAPQAARVLQTNKDDSHFNPAVRQLDNDDDSSYVMVGSWATITSNIDKASLSYDQGSKLTNSQTVTNTWSESVTKSASAGIAVKGVSGSASLSKTKSKEVSNSDQRYWSQSYDSRITLAFPASQEGNVVWQWMYTICESDTNVDDCSSSNVNAYVGSVYTNYFAMGYEDADEYKPKCVGGKCADDSDGTCQTCVDGWELPTSEGNRRFLRGGAGDA